VGDITYLPTREGWLYLAAVLDLVSRRVIGWAMQHTLERTLTVAALDMALARRRPAPGVLHHSDRCATEGRPGERNTTTRPARPEHRCLFVDIATPPARCCDDRLNPPSAIGAVCRVDPGWLAFGTASRAPYRERDITDPELKNLLAPTHGTGT
jgi:hypothetical protein